MLLLLLVNADADDDDNDDDDISNLKIDFAIFMTDFYIQKFLVLGRSMDNLMVFLQ